MAGGILYPDGKIWGKHNTDQQWRQLGYLLGNATQGVWDAASSRGKSAPDIMLHSEQGGKYDACQWFFTNLRDRSTYDEFDTITVSFYPVRMGKS